MVSFNRSILLRQCITWLILPACSPSWLWVVSNSNIFISEGLIIFIFDYFMHESLMAKKGGMKCFFAGGNHFYASMEWVYDCFKCWYKYCCLYFKWFVLVFESWTCHTLIEWDLWKFYLFWFYFVVAVVGASVPSGDECELSRIPYTMADPEQCDAFFRCDNGFLTSELCDDGMVYHETDNICDMPQRVNCSGRETLQPAKGSGNCPRLNGLYHHQEFCDQYYYCRVGLPLLVTCPLGLVYDLKVKHINLIFLFYSGQCIYLLQLQLIEYFFDD